MCNAYTDGTALNAEAHSIARAPSRCAECRNPLPARGIPMQGGLQCIARYMVPLEGLTLILLLVSDMEHCTEALAHGSAIS